MLPGEHHPALCPFVPQHKREQPGPLPLYEPNYYNMRIGGRKIRLPVPQAGYAGRMRENYDIFPLQNKGNSHAFFA
jgi:hypothetical protein